MPASGQWTRKVTEWKVTQFRSMAREGLLSRRSCNLGHMGLSNEFPGKVYVTQVSQCGRSTEQAQTQGPSGSRSLWSALIRQEA